MSEERGTIHANAAAFTYSSYRFYGAPTWEDLTEDERQTWCDVYEAANRHLSELVKSFGRNADPAQRAYSAYGNHLGWVGADGRSLPRWSDLPERSREAIRAAIKAAR